MTQHKTWEQGAVQKVVTFGKVIQSKNVVWYNRVIFWLNTVKYSLSELALTIELDC